MTRTATAPGTSGRSKRTLGFAALAVAAIVLAGCGGAAGTAAPTAVPTIAPPASLEPATPEPTEAPTAEATEAPTAEATEAPTAEATEPAEPEITTPPAGTVLFGYEDMLAYYEATGYQCQEPGPSAVAAGYTTHICTLDREGGTTDMIGFLVAGDGTLGDVFAGVLNPAGGEMPATVDMIAPLAFILGATLGETEGAAAAEWLVENLGADMAEKVFNGNTVRTYTVNDDSGVGAFSEVATPAYNAAPAP